MMKYVKQIEGMAETWLKKVPHLPKGGQKWLADNIWWIVLIGAIAYGISVLATLSSIAYFNSGINYLLPSFAAWSTVFALVNLVFYVIIALLLAMAVKPLKELTKKGWTLLFMVLLVDVVALVVGAVLSFVKSLAFSGAGFFAFTGLLFTVIFGAIFTAIAAYFLFEIRAQFAHVTKGATKK